MVLLVPVDSLPHDSSHEDTVFIFNLELRWGECREVRHAPFLHNNHLPSFSSIFADGARLEYRRSARQTWSLQSTANCLLYRSEAKKRTVNILHGRTVCGESV
jgi:hypothetical protein